VLRARIAARIFVLLLPYLGALGLVLLRYDSLLPQSTNSVLINEADAETPGSDTAEFVELYDGGSGHTSLDGLVVVFFNGQDDRSYRTFDLAGYQTNDAGYFLVANDSVPGVDLIYPDNVLQNGPDAVALYLGQGSDFPNGTAVTTANLQDALVYDSDHPDDPGLLVLLQSGEPQVNENGRELAEFHSNQRCPDGGGGSRQTAGYIQEVPTPKSSNNCPVVGDNAPTIAGLSPAANSTNVPTGASISVTFSEAVIVSSSWYDIDCSLSGEHTAAVSRDGTTYTLNPTTDFAYGENCSVSLVAALIADVDTQDPPDQMAEDYSWSFSIEDPPVASQIIINEVDADTPGSDTAEFVELYDGGTGATALDGLVVVLFNGSDDSSYRAIDLDGQTTDGQGYFVIGNAAVVNVDLTLPDGALQNDANAIAIYQGSDGDFANGTAVSTANLLDAIVYGTDDEEGAGLLVLLNAGQPQVNEANRDNSAFDSNQRCPNAAGGQRNTAAYLQNLPTPGAVNKCTFDSPPHVIETWPANGQQDMGQNISLTVTFNEAVRASADAFELTCSASGSHSLAISGGPTQFTISPNSGFTAGENCMVQVTAAEISDQDTDDPPDHMATDHSWSFGVRSVAVARHMVINEVDADTAGTDTAEFVELFDGGGGSTRLDGLVIVLFNGYGDTSYRAIDLDGFMSGPSGYFTAGSKDVAGVDLVLPDGVIQNGADAAAIYAANSADFPNGSPVTLTGLLDALVYDTNDEDDAGLIALLEAGQPQVNEAARDNKDFDSNQRCPNGQGGQRNSSGFLQNPATPGSVNDCTIDAPPSVNETTPADGENDIALDSNLTVRFNEDVQVNGDWFEIRCSQSLTHSAVQSGGPREFTLNPQVNFESGEQCLVSIFAGQIMDLDGLPQAMVVDYTWNFATGAPLFGDCGDPATPIHIIQGSAQNSPLTGAQAVIAEGIVVGDFQGREALGGFYLQEEEAEQDHESQTSEGIFIHDEGLWIDIDAGETVRVQGTVAEIDDLTSLTDLIALRGCGSGSLPVPKPVVLPVTALSTWERVEGMLIALPQNLSVTGSEQLGSEGIVDLALDGRLFYPTETAEPGQPALDAADLNNRSRIKLDDGSGQLYPLPLPPYLGQGNSLRIGDLLPSVTGVMSDSSGEYRIHPTQPVNFTSTNIPQHPYQPIDIFLRAAVFDLGDYFNGDGQGGGFPGPHGAATGEEFARQRAKIISALAGMKANFIALLSLENDGYGAESAIQDLVDGLNEAAADGASFTFIDPALPKLGSGEMTVGLIYRQEWVIPLGTAVTTGSPPFDGSSIPPLVQAFTDSRSDESFILAVTQLPDRDQCPPEGDPNTDQNDGQECWNKLRTEAAGTLVDFLNTDPTGMNGDDILVLGGLNAYTREDPLAAFAAAGYTNLSSRHYAMGYTSVAHGESGTVVHALASPRMISQVGDTFQWHINADEPSALDYNMVNQPSLFNTDVYRSSRHDPLLIDLFLHSEMPPPKKIFLPITLTTTP